jgi:hypothetical protein
MVEKIYQYKHLYFGVLAACNLLPEEEDASTLYLIEDDELDEDTITPQNADRYPALEVFRCIHAAEGDVLKTKLSQLQQGRTNGAIADGGFIEWQDIGGQGEYIKSHVGRVLNVEVEVAENVWVKGSLETVEQVTRLNSPSYPLKLETAKGCYAMDIGEKQIWFVGDKAKVSYLTLKRPLLPDSIENLAAQLKEPIQADDEDASAIIELACSMLMPIGGNMEGAASARMQRAMTRLGMGATPAMPDAQAKINAKLGAE